MNTKNEKTVINDKELEEVNGGVMPVIFKFEPKTPSTNALDTSLGNKVPTIDPISFKPDSEKKSEKDTLVPIPY